ncbi:MAG: hypothetical protein C4324_12410 [Blastocatellia bacterium]
MRSIAGSKKFLRTNKKIGIVFAPKHRAAFLEIIPNPRLGIEQCLDNVKTAADEKWAIFLRKSHRLLGQQGIFSAQWVVMNIIAGCLIDQPFANTSLIGARCIGELAVVKSSESVSAS